MLNESTTGALALVIDKYDAKVEKGHTLVEYAARGLSFPDDYTEPWAKGSYVGTYEYMPDGSWKGAGTGTETFIDGSTTYTWEEGSHLTENTYKYTGGTGKYKGASGDGTYTLYEGVSGGEIKLGTLQGCRYNDKIVMR